MRTFSSLGVVIGLLTAFLGVAGLIVPQVFVELAWVWTTSTGLYVSAALDIVVGLILAKAAPPSRSPVALSAFAAITLIGGILTPFLGQARARAYATWWSAQNPAILRLWACLVLATGVLIAVAAAPRRRMLRPAAG